MLGDVGMVSVVPGGKREYTGILDCASKIMKEEGIGGFLKVMQMRNSVTPRVTISKLHAWVRVLPDACPDPQPALSSPLSQGWQPRVLWIGIGGSVFFTALELSKKLYAPKPQYVVVDDGKKK